MPAARPLPPFWQILQSQVAGCAGTPLDFVIVAQAYSSAGGPGGQWGAEFSSAIPSMELFEGEAMEMAVESGVIRDKDYVHVGEAPSVPFAAREHQI